MFTRYGCFLKNPGDFDNRFFNISPKEALQMDPIQRLLLMVTYEALQAAGYSEETKRSRIATFFGQTTQDWWSVNDEVGPQAHYMPSTVRAYAPGKLNHFFGWSGGYTSVDTACTSSITALYEACNSLLSRDCDTAVVGGGQLCVLSDTFSGLSKGSFLSPTGQCKTFQDTADGYCRGEAVGVVVVKRLEDAVRANDNILGVVKGVVKNTNAGGVSITYPKEDAQVDLFNKLLRKTGARPDDINFIELHGTGTVAGDTTEMASIRRVFAAARSPQNPLYVGALKANFGHTEASAGIASLMKALLVLQRGQLPPQPHQPFKVNSRFPNLRDLQIHIADNDSITPFASLKNGPRRAVVNTLDAAGGNACVLLEQAPTCQKTSRDPRKSHVVVCSGKTKTALERNKINLLEYLQTKGKDICLEDVAFTTTARRLHDKFRQAFVADSIESLIAKLETASTISNSMVAIPKTQAPLLFAFSGQGVQYSGMASNLYHICRSFQESIDSFEAICQHHVLDSFIDVVRGGKDLSKGTSAQLQIATASIQVALAQYWQSLGFQPASVIGHSLGEYAALCFAGVLSPTDMLLLVDKRAKLMDEHCKDNEWHMMAVDASSDTMKKYGKAGCEISCINSPSSIVVSGPKKSIIALQKELGAEDVRTKILDTRYGFHSSQMDPIMSDYEKFGEKILFRSPRIPVASTTLGRVITSDGTFNASYLVHHLRHSVKFVDAIRACESEDYLQNNSLVLEIGVHPMCTGLILASHQSLTGLKTMPSLSKNVDDWASISQFLATAYTAGYSIDWAQFHRHFSSSVRPLDLPSYSWDLQTYWIPYEARDPRANLKTFEQKPPVKTSESLTSSVQFIKSITSDSIGRVTGVFTTNTSEPHLNEVIQGHIVNGVAICQASVFIDMAMTAARHLLKRAHQTLEVTDLELNDLDMKHPLVVVVGDDNQTIEITAITDESGSTADITFKRKGTEGSSTAILAICNVSIGTSSTQWLWSRTQDLVKSRGEALELAVKDNSAHRLLQPLVYKLFGSVVEYGDSYKALKEVIVPLDGPDVVAQFQMPPPGKPNGSFEMDPYVADAFFQISGFVLNGSLNRPSDKIFISNRIGQLRVIKFPGQDQKLSVYCSTRGTKQSGQIVCDVYVYSGEDLYAIATGIQFQELQRTTFSALVNRSKSSMSSTVSETRPPEITQTMPLAKQKAPSIHQRELDPNSQTSLSPVRAFPGTKDTPNPVEILLDVTADQTGIPKSDITDVTDFASLGVDSQMAIAILADFKKQTGIELTSSFFVSFSTVEEARSELLRQVPNATGARTTPTTPRKHIESQAETVSSDTSHTGLTESLLDVTADQTGISKAEISETTDFASLGVDSQMAIAILAAFRKRTGVDLSPSFFVSFSTVQEARAELDRTVAKPVLLTKPETASSADYNLSRNSHEGLANEPVSPFRDDSHPSSPDEFSDSSTRNSMESFEDVFMSQDDTDSAVGNSTPQSEHSSSHTDSSAILIHGYPRSKSASLFLLPDESGDAATYFDFPAPTGQRRVYTLGRPVQSISYDPKTTIELLAETFAANIKKMQPNGPYFLGGRHAGGTLAYATARHLASIGEKIGGLLIMDMLLDYRTISTKSYQSGEEFRSSLEGESARAEAHARFMEKALQDYEPAPFPSGVKLPRIFVFWSLQAKSTVEDMGGWEEMVGTKNIRVRLGQNTSKGKDHSVITKFRHLSNDM